MDYGPMVAAPAKINFQARNYLSTHSERFLLLRGQSYWVILSGSQRFVKGSMMKDIFKKTKILEKVIIALLFVFFLALINALI